MWFFQELENRIRRRNSELLKKSVISRQRLEILQRIAECTSMHAIFRPNTLFLWLSLNEPHKKVQMTATNILFPPIPFYFNARLWWFTFKAISVSINRQFCLFIPLFETSHFIRKWANRPGRLVDATKHCSLVFGHVSVPGTFSGRFTAPRSLRVH